jgi:hypothetical protein
MDVNNAVFDSYNNCRGKEASWTPPVTVLVTTMVLDMKIMRYDEMIKDMIVIISDKLTAKASWTPLVTLGLFACYM